MDNEYNERAELFLKKTETTFKAEFVGNKPHFIGEKINRDVYKITLKRGERKCVFEFGQSINNTGKPTPYDVLACLTKKDVGTFEDFCADFGYDTNYDTDSINAKKEYDAVINEWNNVKMLWSDKEIVELQQIE